MPALSAIVVALLCVPLGTAGVAAGPIDWMGDTGRCYDRGVFERKPIVILFYDKTKNRFEADSAATRLSLSPRIRAVAASAVWCFADISSDVVPRNIGQALKQDALPALSVLRPNGDMLDEVRRVPGLVARVPDAAWEDAAQHFIVRGIETIAAEYAGKP